MNTMVEVLFAVEVKPIDETGWKLHDRWDCQDKAWTSAQYAWKSGQFRAVRVVAQTELWRREE
jgi:hypothetical protein